MFERIREDGRTFYRHHSGHWEVERQKVPNYRAYKWTATYTGPEREPGCEPTLKWSETLTAMQRKVEGYFDPESESDYKKRAVSRLANGDIEAAVDCVFQYLDFKFQELEDKLNLVDDRLSRHRF